MQIKLLINLLLLVFLPCFGLISQKETELIALMDQIITAKRYWKTTSTDIKQLTHAQTKLARALGDKTLTFNAAPEIDQILSEFAVPSHFRQNWKTYMGWSAGAAVAIAYLKGVLSEQETRHKCSLALKNTFIEPMTDLFKPSRPHKQKGPSREMLVETLITVGQIALEEGNYDELFSPFERASKKINVLLSLEELQHLRDRIIEMGESKGVLNGFSYNMGRKLSFRNSALLSAYISEYIEFKMKCAAFFSGVKTFANYLSLAPTAVLSFCGYKGTGLAVARHHYKTVIEPLTIDLKEFESFLYATFEKPKDAEYYGMQTYWVNRLKKYTPLITKKEREHFEADLEHMNPGLPIERQLNIVDSLLHHKLQKF